MRKIKETVCGWILKQLVDEKPPRPKPEPDERGPIDGVNPSLRTICFLDAQQPKTRNLGELRITYISNADCLALVHLGTYTLPVFRWAYMPNAIIALVRRSLLHSVNSGEASDHGS